MRVRSLVVAGLGLTASLLPLTTALAQRVDPMAPLPTTAAPTTPRAATPLPSTTAPAQLPAPDALPAVPVEDVPVLPPAVWQPGDVAQLSAYIRAVGTADMDEEEV